MIRIRHGENVRFIIINKTMMHHPMHLHGHFFRVINGQGDYSPLKHTVGRSSSWNTNQSSSRPMNIMTGSFTVISSTMLSLGWPVWSAMKVKNWTQILKKFVTNSTRIIGTLRSRQRPSLT